MWLNELRERWLGRSRNWRLDPQRSRQNKARLQVRGFENRITPTTFNALNAAALSADIATANTNGQASNTINLTGNPAAYALTSPLPAINPTTTSTLTINGEGAILSGFGNGFNRILAVDATGHLVLKNATIEGGRAVGTGANAEGGGLANFGGIVALTDVNVRSNGADAYATRAATGNSAAGGGIFSSGGTLTLTGCLVQKNFAFGGYQLGGGTGGAAYGGGVAVIGGKVTIGAGTVLESNSAGGGAVESGAGVGGAAYGGGLYVNGSTSVSLTSTTFEYDQAAGSFGGHALGSHGATGGTGGNGYGGGAAFVSSTTKLTNSAFHNCVVFGGNGGTGAANSAGQGGTGGVGGNAYGGGLYATGGTLAESGGLAIDGCEANYGSLVFFTSGGSGGPGGASSYVSGPVGGTGGAGGNAYGGGMATVGTPVTMNAAATIQGNSAWGGWGGTGRSSNVASAIGGTGGAGGSASGGGLYAIGAGAFSLENSSVQYNQAQGGLAELAGYGGKSSGRAYGDVGVTGNGAGGGLYVGTTSGAVTLKYDTVAGNTAVGDFWAGGSAFYAYQAYYDGRSGGGGGGQGGGIYLNRQRGRYAHGPHDQQQRSHRRLGRDSLLRQPGGLPG